MGSEDKENVNPVAYNKSAWDRQVALNNRWTLPVSAAEIAEAKRGHLKLVLTPTKSVPLDWFPPLKGCQILALASGGGQQGPLLAASGADVTVFDNSPKQLARDREVADREGLSIRLVEGDMADLSVFADESFDFIFHPCSNIFVPDVKPVWKEAYRVLKRGGSMIAGFCNPVLYTLDIELEKQGIAQMRYALPYSDLHDLTEAERLKFFGPDEPLNFSHTLEDQIGGQLNAGFVLTGFYEDSWDDTPNALGKFMKCFLATSALKT